MINMYDNQDNGFVSSCWGPVMWFLLHMISFTYPVEPTLIDKNNYRVWFECLGKVLPCGPCRNKFQGNLKSIEYNPDHVFANRDTFVAMVYKLHKLVNNSKHNIDFTTMVNWYKKLQVATDSKCQLVFQEFETVEDCGLHANMVIDQVNQSRHNDTTEFPYHCVSTVVWFLMYIISLNFPLLATDEIRDYYWIWFTLLVHVVPSTQLRNELSQVRWCRCWFRTRDSLSQQIYSEYKPTQFDTYDKMRTVYEKLRATSCKGTTNSQMAVCASTRMWRCVIRIKN